MHFANKFLHAHQKNHLRWQNLTNRRTDLVAQHLKCFYGRSEQSLFKVFLYKCLTRLCSHPPPKALTAFIVSRLLALRCKSFIIYKNAYIQRLLLLFLVIFSVSLSGSDVFNQMQMFYAIFQCCTRMETRLLIWEEIALKGQFTQK